jgi:hypothetical protein
MGLPIDEKEVPLDMQDLSYNCQQALFLFNVLPDKVEGMNGIWLGKEYAGLMDIMDIYDILDRAEVMDFLVVCVNEASKHYEKQRKLEQKKIESQSKMRK